MFCGCVIKSVLVNARRAELAGHPTWTSRGLSVVGTGESQFVIGTETASDVFTIINARLSGPSTGNVNNRFCVLPRFRSSRVPHRTTSQPVLIIRSMLAKKYAIDRRDA